MLHSSTWILICKKKSGRLFVCGFAGKEPDEQARFLLEDLRIGNWIFFARNVEGHEQVSELCRRMLHDTEQHNGSSAFMTIDQEGGIVSRIHGDLNTYPGAMALAALGDENRVQQAARITAGHLRSLGFNMNIAPVCDINSNPENPIIGPRSYGDSSEDVARLALAAMRGYREGGVVPVLKHFPGHGDTAVDSHLSLPQLPHSRELLEERELIPFIRGIEADAPAIMVAHILVPSVDSSGLPASLSREIISDLLRSSLSFKGLVITDCLEMQGVRNQFSTAEATLLALEAGSDLLCISHTAEEQEKGFRAVYDAVVSGRISESRIDDSLKRIQHCQSALPREKTITGRGWGEHPDSVLQDMSRKSLTLVRNKGFLPAGGLVDSPEMQFLVLQRPEQFIGENTVSGGSPMKRIEKAFPRSRFCTVPASATAEDILQPVLKNLSTRILIITSDAGFHPTAMEAIGTICETEASVGVAVMRTPYEAGSFTGADFIVLTYEDTVLAVESLIAFLRGEIRAEGSCPVRIPGLS